MTPDDLKFFLYAACLVVTGIMFVMLGFLGTGEGKGVQIAIGILGLVVVGYAIHLGTVYLDGGEIKIRWLVYAAPFGAAMWVVKAYRDRAARRRSAN